MKISIPCSTSNLGPGFDTLGLALNRYLFLEISLNETFAITMEGNGREHIATDTTNLVYNAANVTAKNFGKKLPEFRLHLKNEIPAYGGLGGSGAAIAGGVVLANEVLQLHLTKEEMLNIAVSIEGHPDNVSAALFGGLTINCYDTKNTVRCRSVKIEKPLSVITCSPHFQVETKKARTILPQNISLSNAVTNIENVASLVAALLCEDFSALSYATEDTLHEQYRATLIPGFHDVKTSARNAGALSFNISGAGPTVFAFAVENEEAIGNAMVKTFAKHHQHSTMEIMHIENSGAKILP